ncbi:MAG: hypothetical protein KDA31_09030 [Phycisphaerales bacterium]|nr:hypothetical protein [Phycisphaerales bacterium]MCB9836834.1 hypothetical protein [Phycisphaera sp.]
MTQTAEMTFDEHCRDAVLALRGALLDLYREAGAVVEKPQDVARRYKLNKNLTWKIARILQTEDAYAAVPLIPGASGFEILLDAMQRAGAPANVVARVRAAAEGFDRMIEIHTGDRATLELALDSMGGERPLEMSRKLAFRGNSGVWGIQSHVRVTTQFLAPSAEDPALLDAALIGGMTRVRRLRHVPRWPVFQLRQYNDDGTTPNAPEPISIEEDDESGPWLMKSFCGGAMPRMHIKESAQGLTYEIGDGPVGKTGEFTCFFGYFHRQIVPRYREEQNRVAELFSTVSIPAESLLFDLIVHRDLVEAMRPEVELYGKLWGADADSLPASRLPCSDQVIDLGVGAQLATPLVPRYAEMVRKVMDNMGWNPGEFRCLRLIMLYPPMPSTVVMRYPLPTAGE